MQECGEYLYDSDMAPARDRIHTYSLFGESLLA